MLLYILYSYYFIMAIVHSSLSFGCYSFFSGAVSLYQPTVSTNQLVLQCIITLGTSYFVRIFINLMLPAFSKSAHGGEFPSSDATLLKGCTGNEDSQASRRTRIPSFSSPHPNYPKKKYINLVPFTVGMVQAKGLFREWAEKLWFKPAQLLEVEPCFHAVYAPCYQFKFTCTKTFREKEGSGEFICDCEMCAVVCASANKRELALLKDVCPWNLRGVHLIDEHEILSEDVDQAFIECCEAARPTCRKYDPWWNVWEEFYKSSAFMEDEIEETYKGLPRETLEVSIQKDARNLRHTLVYVPVYIATYKWNGQAYLFVVNGKTGATAGERPYWGQHAVSTGFGLIKQLLVPSKNN